MKTSQKKFTDFLIAVGAGDVAHTEKTYLAHAVGVHNDLKSWGCNDEVCLAGMFHSIYGTQRFQGFTLPLERRDAVRDLIGARAERLAYWNCVMDRSSFDEAAARDEPPYTFVDRITREPVELPPDDFDDLCRIHLCDWLEQASRARDPEYRRAAYRRLAVRLGGAARSAFERVFPGDLT
jgi:hypothetical protein